MKIPLTRTARRWWHRSSENLTAYKNRNGGIWGRGELHEFRNVKLADNAMGFTHASGAFGRYAFTSKVVDSLFVGETENVGNPRTDAEKAYGRTPSRRSICRITRSTATSTTITAMTW